MLLALALTPLSAHATIYGFTAITNNSAQDASTAGQYSVDVTSYGATQVQFKFTNAGPAASSITDVYIDDNDLGLLSFSSISGSDGVSFSQGASPPNLPSGNSIGFSAALSAYSDPPAQPNGVNPDEELKIIFNLLSGDFDDLIDQLYLAKLQIGIHVQGFADGKSESFVTYPECETCTPLPEPASLSLIAMALAGLTAFGRRKA